MDKNAPFQTYDDRTNAADCAPRLAALRSELAKRDLDGFVVPRSDEYQSEYVSPHGERLAWLTAFTGSAGAAIAMKDSAAIFVDGRYTLQVRQQTDTSLFEPRDLVNEGVAGWIESHASKGARIGYDPWLHTQTGVDALRAAAEKAGAAMVAVDNLIDAVWHDQPPEPTELAVPHAMNLAGESAESKRTRIAEDVKALGGDAAVVTLSDSICWLLNIRGHDLPHTPFVLSYVILNADGSTDLFMDERKSSPELVKHLGNAVRIRDPKEFPGALATLNGKAVLADPTSAPSAVFDRLKAAGARIRRAFDPIQLPKACKNPVEIEGTRKAHIRDGAALTKFLAWLSREAPGGHLTEIDASTALEGYRRATGALTRPLLRLHLRRRQQRRRGALPRHREDQPADPQQRDIPHRLRRPVSRRHPDVTRTVIVGEPTAEMKDRFTRVLKGHIALATLRFPEGTTGQMIDGFARKFLWDVGLDYDHGTGHGVGSYLSVHEGPQNISRRAVQQPLKPGMICSNEPGYYKTNEYGIRIENLIVVTEPKDVGGDRRMMEFETITLSPIDLTLIDTKLLTEPERAWLNAYHARVREELSKLVDGETRAWLEQATQAI